MTRNVGHVRWWCVAFREPVRPVPCTAGGVYVATATSGGAGPAAAHTSASSHPTEARWVP